MAVEMPPPARAPQVSRSRSGGAGQAGQMQQPACASQVSCSGSAETGEVTSTHFSTPWLLLGLVGLVAQLALSGDAALAERSALQGALTAAQVLSVLFLIGARLMTTKRAKTFGYAHISCPTDEEDIVPVAAICCVLGAIVLYGLVLGSIFLADGMPSSKTVFCLRSSALTVYAMHRVLRPADRLDPLRTALELESIEISIDAIDGAAFLPDSETPDVLRQAFIACGVLWYVSVSFRVVAMGLVHLPPSSLCWRFLRFGMRRFLKRQAQVRAIPGRYDVILRPEAQEACQRNAVAVWLRMWVLGLTLPAEVLALLVRFWAWNLVGAKEQVQTEFMMKNAVGIWRASNAIGLYMWYPPVHPSKYADLIPKLSPSTTAAILLSVAVLSYGGLSGALTYLVYEAKPPGLAVGASLANCGCDVVLILVLVVVMRRLMKRRPMARTPWSMRVITPYGADRFAACASWSMQVAPVLFLSLTSLRLPMLFYNAERLPSGRGIVSYSSVLMVVNGINVPMMVYSTMASTFSQAAHPDETIMQEYPYCWNPSTWLVSQAQFTEAVMDVASSVEFLRYAVDGAGLPMYMLKCTLTFGLLELWSAFLCYMSASFLLVDQFGLRMSLDAASLVRAKAFLRFLRLILDLGSFAMRLTLWLAFGQPLSLFFVKSGLQILHAIAMIERGMGADKYRASSPYNLQIGVDG